MTDTNTASGAADLRAVLQAVRDTLQRENDRPNGSIADTIWHGPCETLFDFIDAALESAAAPAQQPNTAYAALPEECYFVSGGLVKTWDEGDMRAFADATHALRASRGQAPAGWAIVPADATDAMMAAFAKAAAADIDWHGATEVERQEVRDGFGPAYRAMLAAVPVPRPDSVLEDAARYRHIRDVPHSEEVRSVLIHQQNAVMDRAIDKGRAAMAAKKGGEA